MMIKQMLSCDWGTSSFRLRLIDVTDRSVLAETTEGNGIAIVYNEWLHSGQPENNRVDFYRNILLSQIEKLNSFSLAGVPVMLSGMASSSIGIMELPYGDIPFIINDFNLNVRRIPAAKECPHDIFLVSGLRTNDDVMRGEETILAGCHIENITAPQLFIFPGTHSKHVTVQNGMVKGFKTYMTGELFDLVSNKSILAASVAHHNTIPTNFEPFIKGVLEAATANLLNSIFHVRTSQLFEKLSKKENYHYLSGLLIGEELKNIRNENYASVTVVSTGVLSAIYTEAISVMDLKNKLHRQNSEEALIAGQIFIFNHYQ